MGQDLSDWSKFINILVYQSENMKSTFTWGEPIIWLPTKNTFYMIERFIVSYLLDILSLSIMLCIFLPYQSVLNLSIFKITISNGQIGWHWKQLSHSNEFFGMVIYSTPHSYVYILKMVQNYYNFSFLSFKLAHKFRKI